jgi:hypothetical protein
VAHILKEIVQALFFNSPKKNRGTMLTSKSAVSFLACLLLVVAISRSSIHQAQPTELGEVLVQVPRTWNGRQSLAEINKETPSFEWSDENVDLFMLACQSGDQNACETIVRSDEALESLNRRAPKAGQGARRRRRGRVNLDTKGFDADWDEVVSS